MCVCVAHCTCRLDKIDHNVEIVKDELAKDLQQRGGAGSHHESTHASASAGSSSLHASTHSSAGASAHSSHK